MKISKKATTIAIVNQKGGTGKTTTCENLGIGLAMEGKKVLLVDTCATNRKIGLSIFPQNTISPIWVLSVNC